MAAHLDVCPQQPIPCTAAMAGCGWVGVLAEQVAHEAACPFAICLRMMAPLQVECQQLRAETQELKAECQELRGRVRALEGEVEEEEGGRRLMRRIDDDSGDDDDEAEAEAAVAGA